MDTFPTPTINIPLTILEKYKDVTMNIDIITKYQFLCQYPD